MLLRFAQPFLLAALAVPGDALSQPDSPPPADDALPTIVAQVEEVQQLHGVDSPELIEPLTALGLFYQEQGERDLAAATFERARALVRVTYGLFSLLEAPLLRQLIFAEAAKGNVELAWYTEQKLLTIARRAPNDLRSVPILREIADRRMEVLRRYESGERPREIILGCYYDDDQNDGGQYCHAGSRRVAIASLRAEVAGLRAEADEVVARYERWTSSPCERPQMPEIAQEQDLSKSASELAEAEAAGYLNGMSDYVACLDVKHAHAASTSAPASELTALTAERSAAIAEQREARSAFEQRFGGLD